jgi:hypothetical protein
MESHVYLIGSPDHHFVKVGYATNPQTRLVELQMGSPFPLVLLDTVTGGLALEQLLHAHFADRYQRGEWFAFPEWDAVAQLHAYVLDDKNTASPVNTARQQLSARLAREARLAALDPDERRQYEAALATRVRQSRPQRVKCHECGRTLGHKRGCDSRNG